jgi:hypothetical protein
MSQVRGLGAPEARANTHSPPESRCKPLHGSYDCLRFCFNRHDFAFGNRQARSLACLISGAAGGMPLIKLSGLLAPRELLEDLFSQEREQSNAARMFVLRPGRWFGI